MKKRLAKLWYFALFFFVCILSCSEEKFEESSGIHFGVKPKSMFKARHLKNASLTKALSLLETASQKSSKFNMSFRSNEFGYTNIGVIDFSEVIEITDSLGYTYTTFKMKDHPEDDYKIFHNLLLENKNGELNLKLIQYEMSDEFVMKYYHENAQFTEFSGKMTTNFLTEQKYPCIQEISGGGNSGGGGGSGGGYGGGGSGGGGSSGGGGGYGGGGSSGGGGSGGGNGIGGGILNWYIQCLDPNCGATYPGWDDFEGSQCDIWNTPFTIVFIRSATLENFNINYYNPCLQDPLVTAIIDPGSRNERCKKMSIISNSYAYNNTISTLNQHSYGNKEYAWVYSFFPNTTTIKPPSITGHNSPINTSVNIKAFLGTAFGFFHNHTVPATSDSFMVPVFSPADIHQLFHVAFKHNMPNGIEKDYSLYFVGLVFQGRTFQIKLSNDDWNDMQSRFQSNWAKFAEDLPKLYENKYKATNSNDLDTYLRILLEQLETNQMDVEVYEETTTTPNNGDPPYKSWKLKTLGQNGTIRETDCITNK